MWLELVLISERGIFNVLEETKVRCYTVLFGKNSLIKTLLQNIHQGVTLCDKLINIFIILTDISP